MSGTERPGALSVALVVRCSCPKYRLRRGGSAGIGLALAKELVRLGNEVIITGRNAGRLAGAASEVPGQANQLHSMFRIAPGFINAQLDKGSRRMIPPPE